MKPSIAKRSIVIRGRKTSVSLEDAFWKALQRIAVAQRTSASQLIAAIDGRRDHDGNLSSAIRVFILDHYVSCAEGVALNPERRPTALEQIRATEAGLVPEGAETRTVLP